MLIKEQNARDQKRKNDFYGPGNIISYHHPCVAHLYSNA